MDVINLYLEGNGQGAKKLQFEIVILAIVLIWVFTRVFRNNYGALIILLVFVYVIANIWIRMRTNKVTDFNKITMHKLKMIQDKVNESISIQIIQLSKTNNGKLVLSKDDIAKIYNKNRLDSMYIDANMIHFIYSILSLHNFNQHEFFLFVKGVNNLLRMRKEIEEFHEKNDGKFPINTAEMFQTALELRKNTVNNLHNFIYSVPTSNSMYKYIEEIVGRFQVLISRNTDRIRDLYQLQIKKEGINSTTKFVSYDTTKPFDRLDNHPIVPNKNDPQNLIKLYL